MSRTVSFPPFPQPPLDLLDARLERLCNPIRKPPMPSHDAPEPRWLAFARTLIGTRETPGAANSPAIMGWARTLGGKVVGVDYGADSQPWCGLFVARCFAAADIAPPPLPVRATNWAPWGRNLRPERLAPGAVLVFQRPGGGHVGFYLGEDDRYYAVLGGNQGDAVSIARILKARCIARRWPDGVSVIGHPHRIATAAPTSNDEA